MSEVRSSELEIGLSSSGDPVEGDTTVSNPREVRAFYTLNEECGLDADTLGRSHKTTLMTCIIECNLSLLNFKL